jgi:S-adenosyl-L-methionine hydrolase (adenosine-forming)
MAGPGTVFFLSDYGVVDEFVGVVHAVIARLAPDARVIDLGHGVEPFDVGAGAAMLERAVDHLGPGVVLAVVDPGVGGSRRAVALEVAAADGPRFFVGPDNGLLVGAAARRGGVVGAVELARPSVPSTFDGRDVLGPVAAALAGDRPLGSLGTAIEGSSLVRLAASPLADAGSLGHPALVSEVGWVDRFGNVQLVARPDDLADVFGPAEGLGPLTVRVLGPPGGRPTEQAAPSALSIRSVHAFAELAPGELGLLVDANGHLAIVLQEASAAARLAVRRGSQIEVAGATDRPLPPGPPGYDPR